MDHYDSTSQIHQKDRLHTSNALTTQSRADTQKQFPALIQVFLSPHFSSDASVVSGNSLQKIEKKKKQSVCCVWDAAWGATPPRTRFITADHKRQALRRNAPTQWTKARHEGRLNKGACLPDYTDQTGWYLQAYFLTFGINYFQFNQLLSCASKTASTASL